MGINDISTYPSLHTHHFLKMFLDLYIVSVYGSERGKEGLVSRLMCHGVLRVSRSQTLPPASVSALSARTVPQLQSNRLIDTDAINQVSGAQHESSRVQDKCEQTVGCVACACVCLSTCVYQRLRIRLVTCPLELCLQSFP